MTTTTTWTAAAVAKMEKSPAIGLLVYLLVGVILGVAVEATQAIYHPRWECGSADGGVSLVIWIAGGMTWAGFHTAGEGRIAGVVGRIVACAFGMFCALSILAISGSFH